MFTDSLVRFKLVRVSTCALLLLAFALLAPMPPVAHAATITVNSLADTAGGTTCTLRNAITAANTNTATGGCIAGTAGADTIVFSVSGTIVLTSPLPTINQALTIDGTGQSITVSGNNAYPVFYVSWVPFTLNRLTIANGRSLDGGGIVNIGDSSVLTITNCTFTNNSTPESGGGIYNGEGVVTIVNSTFSGNSASDRGGGIFNAGGTLNITSSTFSGNSALEGGSIYNNGDATLRNTIVANSPSGGNCAGEPVINAGNNIDSGTTCGWGTTNGSHSNTNPLLGALANNGGPTQTMALLAGSPAIDGVTYNAPNGSPATDQRGIARPQGPRHDIGAFEARYFVVTVTKTGTGTGTVSSSPAGINCGTICSGNFLENGLTLTAAPDAGSTFTGWSGACSGTGACVVPVGAAAFVTATFTQQRPAEVPEANTLLLLGGGLGGIATWLRWKWRRVRSRQKV